MKLNKFAFLCAAGLLAAVSTTHATYEGFQDPFGSHPLASSASFDAFGTDTDPTPALGISALPGATSGSLFTSATLTGAMTGGVLAGSGDRIYNGVAAASAAFDLSLSAEVLDSISTLTLQIRFTQPDGYASHADFFTASLNGSSATGVVTVSSGIGSTGTAPNERNYGIVQFTWSDLSLEADDIAFLSITSPASGHVSVDAIRVDAVPEPSTYVLLGAAGVAAMVLRRRKLLGSKA